MIEKAISTLLLRARAARYWRGAAILGLRRRDRADPANPLPALIPVSRFSPTATGWSFHKATRLRPAPELLVINQPIADGLRSTCVRD